MLIVFLQRISPKQFALIFENESIMSSTIELLKEGLNRRIVIFMDVLGWRREIESYNFNSIVSILALVEPFIKKHLNYNTENPGADIRFTFFSDTFVFSVPTPHNDKNMNTTTQSIKFIFGVLSNFWIAAGSYGWLMRGGISIGEFFHHDHICIGKALHEAYDMESRQAVYPRILISEECSLELETRMRWLSLSEAVKSNRILDIKDTDLKLPYGSLIGEPIYKDRDNKLCFNPIWADSLFILDDLADTFRSKFHHKEFNLKIAERIKWFLNFFNKEALARASSGYVPIQIKTKKSV